MPLTWNIEKVKDSDELNWPLTEAFIFLTMNIGIGRWEEGNIDEVYCRLKMWEKLFGACMHKGKEPYLLTYEDVVKHVGLVTNVAYEAPTKWRNRIWKSVMADIKWERKQNQ